MIVYVGNLPPDISEGTLRGLFLPFGEVLSVAIMNDKYIGSGQSRGYGYVEMSSKFQGEAAVSGLKDTVINGRKINVLEALPLDRKGTALIRKRLTPKIRQRLQ